MWGRRGFPSTLRFPLTDGLGYSSPKSMLVGSGTGLFPFKAPDLPIGRQAEALQATLITEAESTASVMSIGLN